MPLKNQGKIQGRAKTRRLIGIALLTLFLTTQGIIALFLFSFREAFIVSRIEAVIETFFSGAITMASVHADSPSGLTIAGLSIATDSFAFFSEEVEVGFSRDIFTPFKLSRIIIDEPRLSLTIDEKGKKRDISKIVNAFLQSDVLITDARIDLTTNGKTYKVTDAFFANKRNEAGSLITARALVRTGGDGDGIILDGFLGGKLTAIGEYPDVEVIGDIKSEGIGYVKGSFIFRADSAGFAVLHGRQKTDLDIVYARDVMIEEKSRAIAFDEIDARGKIRIVYDTSIRIEDMVLNVPRIGTVAFDHIEFGDGSWEVAAKTDGLILSGANVGNLGAFIPAPLRHWDYSGKISGIMRIGKNARDSSGTAGEFSISLKKVGFASPDWKYMGDGISGTVFYSWGGSRGKDTPLSGTIDIKNFTAIAGDVYFDFKDEKLAASWEGSVSDEGTIDFEALSVSIPRVASFVSSGRIGYSRKPIAIDLDFSLYGHDVKKLMKVCLGDYISKHRPSVFDTADMEIEGIFSASGTMKRNLAKPYFSGSVSVSLPLVDLPKSATKIEGFRATMPLAFDMGRDFTREEARFSRSDYGTIQFENAVLRGVEVKGATLFVTCKKNTLRFFEDPRFSLPGGEIAIKNFLMTNAFSDMRDIRATLDIKTLDLSPTFSLNPTFHPRGELSVALDDIRVSEKKLFTSGTIVVKIFGGVFVIDNMWGSDIFEANRKIGMDVHFTDVDLGETTENIDIGRISGTVDGEVLGLVFSYGEPEHFVFDVSTKDAPHVKKRVSVDFVENLTIFGSGSSLFSGILSSGLNRFIKEYDYDTIGIHLELKDDYFTMRGKIHSDGKEYFIKKSGVTGINVINQNPKNNIRFKDMMERLERIKNKKSNGLTKETQLP